MVSQQVGSSNTGLSGIYGSVSRQENRIWLVSLHGWWQNRWRNGSDWKRLHDRKDLIPNICAVYTEKDYRRKGVAGHLLNMVVSDLKFNGITPVYLVTDHTGLYERYGLEFLCMVQGDGEPDMSRMFIWLSARYVHTFAMMPTVSFPTTVIIARVIFCPVLYCCFVTIFVVYPISLQR